MAGNPFNFDFPGFGQGLQGFGRLPGFDSGRTPSPIQPFSPEEQQSKLQSILDAGMGGLGWVGESLNKALGGRAIRQTLSGVTGGDFNPRELLSILPLSDTLSITDPRQNKSGEDLAKQWGVLEGEGEKGTMEWRDLVGPGIEILTDPSTYASFGASAIGRAGSVAKRMGILPKTTRGRVTTSLADVLKTPEAMTQADEIAKHLGYSLPDIMSQKLGGVAGFKVPFLGEMTPVGGEGTLDAITGAGKYLGSWVPGHEYIGKAAKGLSDWTGRHLGGLFDDRVKGAVTPVAQQLLREGADLKPNLYRLANEKVYGAAQKLHNAGQLTKETDDFVRQYLEGQIHGPMTPEVAEYAGRMKELQDIWPEAMKEAGIKGVRENPDYLLRQKTAPDTPTKGFEGNYQKPQSAFNPSQKEREWFLEDLPGRTKAINELMMDKQVRELLTSNPKAAEDLIQSRYLAGTIRHPTDPRLSSIREGGHGPMSEVIRRRDELKDLTSIGLDESQKEELKLLGRRAKQPETLANYMRAFVDPKHASEQLPFFGGQVYENVAEAMRRGINSTTAADSIFNLLGKSAKATAAEAGPGAVPLSQTLNEAGLTKGRMKELLGIGPESTSKIKDYFLPGDIHNDVTRVIRSITKPEIAQGFLKVIDSGVNMYKGGATSTFPFSIPTYFRNRVGDLWNKLVHGAHDPKFGPYDPRAYAKPLAEASTLFHGGIIDDANKIPGFTHFKTAAEASDALRLEMMSDPRILQRSMMQSQEIMGQPQANESAIDLIRGKAPTLKDIAAGAIPRKWEQANPLKMAGVGQQRKDVFAPTKAGRELESHSDALTRASTWLAKRRQGFNADAAGMEVVKAHYDISNLSGFEKSFMRRLLPYYSWASRNIPAVIKNLIEQPGGLQGQAIRLGGAMKDDSGFTPEHLAGGFALPFGKTDADKQLIASGFGTPLEAAFENIRRTPGKSGMALLSQLNPFIKYPLELTTGKNFYSGRDIDATTPGMLPGPMEHLLRNTPLTRGVTLANIIGRDQDPLTKLLKGSTGIGLSDVDIEASRAAMMRELIKERLRGRPGISSFESLAAQKGIDVNSLPPDVIEALQMLKTLQKPKR